MQQAARRVGRQTAQKSQQVTLVSLIVLEYDTLLWRKPAKLSSLGNTIKNSDPMMSPRPFPAVPHLPPSQLRELLVPIRVPNMIVFGAAVKVQDAAIIPPTFARPVYPNRLADQVTRIGYIFEAAFGVANAHAITVTV